MGAQDARATDDTPRCSIVVRRTAKDKGTEYTNVKAYSYDSDILQLDDPFSVTLSNNDGALSGKLNLGERVEFFMSDPNVENGAKIQKLTGIITRRSGQSSSGGNMVTVQGSNLGWHLSNNCAPLWFSLRGQTFQGFLDKVVDGSWGFSMPSRLGNTSNRGLKQGDRRRVSEQQQTSSFKKAQAEFQAAAPKMTQAQRTQAADNLAVASRELIPRIQVEVGQTISDVLTTFARRLNAFVNVSADGYIQLFAPDYKQPSKYTFHYHRFDYPTRNLNNVQQATLEESIDQLFTDVTAVGEVVLKPVAPDAQHPNLGKYQKHYKEDGKSGRILLPFTRRKTFSESEYVSGKLVEGRARWTAYRGQYDAWTYTVTVKGHSGKANRDAPTLFYEPDTMCEVYDDINGLSGTYYVSAVRYQRDMSGGTTTALTIKKPNLLTAT